MQSLLPIGLAVEQDEIKGFSRTIAEIEWLLLSLVLIYLVVAGVPFGAQAAVEMALFFFGALILRLHYVHFYKRESLLKLAGESVDHDSLRHMGGVEHRQDRKPAAEPLPVASHRQCTDLREAHDFPADRGYRFLFLLLGGIQPDLLRTHWPGSVACSPSSVR